MIQEIDINKLKNPPMMTPTPNELRREGTVFYIGGNLPIYDTLETMYESYCQESTELFHVTFGAADKFGQNLEMIRQIKKNFSMRLMGRIGHKLSPTQVEQSYLAGLDILDLPLRSSGEEFVKLRELESIYRPAVAAFPHWSVYSSIFLGIISPEEAKAIIMELLEIGVVPIPVTEGKAGGWNSDETRSILSFLAAEWHRHRVPLRPVIPLLRMTTPFVFAESSGFMRSVIDKLQDRRVLAASDLRRHLRTSGAEASFESAGL